MRKCFAIVFFATLGVVLCGCGKQPEAFGNFAGADSVELVRDAAAALEANYPPAKTRLALAREAEDAFGAALVETLRADGYAVAEYTPPSARDKYLPGAAKPDGLAFGYILDGTDDELRVSLRVGDETLNRLYRIQRSGDTLEYIPQGFWTFREDGHE